MNDISVKIVDSPKALAAEELPVSEALDAEVDPLAIEEITKAEEEAPLEKTPAICDENAKEETSNVCDSNVAEKVETGPEVNVSAKTDKEDASSAYVATAVEETAAVEQSEPLPEESQVAKTTVADSKESTDIKSPEPGLVLVPIKESPEPETTELAEEPIKEEEKLPSPDPEPPVQEIKETIPEKSLSPQEPVVRMEIVEEKVEKAISPQPAASKGEEELVQEVEMTEVAVRVETTPPLVEKVEEKKDNLDAVIDKVAEGPREPQQKEVKPPSKPVNGDVSKDEQATKRRASEEVETDSPLKKLCQEVEKTFPQHDTMINDYIQTATKNNIDEIQRHTEQLLAEIQTLRELAQKKEHEWNNILHLKKVKEEILLRLLRRKQVLSYEKAADINGSDRTDPFDYLNQAKNLAIDKSDEISGLAIKQPGSNSNPMIQPPVMPVTSHFNPMSGLPPPYDKAAHLLQSMPKPVYPQPMMMPGPMPGFPRDMNGQLPSNFNLPMGRQGPTKDVKSIIADYRQRNPDITPRRGRRMKSILNPNMMNAPRPIAPKVDGMNSLTNLNMLFNNLDMNQKAMLERLQQIQAGGSPNSIFKDALVQFANMQQAAGMMPNRPPETITTRPEHHVKERRRERNHEDMKPERMPSTSPRLPPPPPYPEISLLPVSTSQDASQTQNSLLHGILTKQAPPQSFSPTLAKLLTSPERKQSASAPPPVLPTFGQAKNCGEITITPVQPAPPPPEPQPEKTEEVVQLDDEESAISEGSGGGSPSGGAGRLVIDEGGSGGGVGGTASGAGAEAEPEAPLCQGCRRRDAQFVCAGCANQWYCSRDCQVAAWDEHSEMCSG